MFASAVLLDGRLDEHLIDLYDRIVAALGVGTMFYVLYLRRHKVTNPYFCPPNEMSYDLRACWHMVNSLDGLLLGTPSVPK